MSRRRIQEARAKLGRGQRDQCRGPHPDAVDVAGLDVPPGRDVDRDHGHGRCALEGEERVKGRPHGRRVAAGVAEAEDGVEDDVEGVRGERGRRGVDGGKVGDAEAAGLGDQPLCRARERASAREEREREEGAGAREESGTAAATVSSEALLPEAMHKAHVRRRGPAQSPPALVLALTSYTGRAVGFG